MGLTEEEKGLLEKLTKKAEEPDAPPIGKNVSFTLDLGDDEQVKKAIGFGLLPDIFTKTEENPPKDGDEPPKRQGYFK